MPSSLNVQPAKRADAASLAAHAYRFGSAEDHVDRDRTHLNQVLHGPATFEATRAGIDALPDKQPNGRKIRTDANYTAQLICTFPEELDESQLDEWARETVAWAKDQAPGQLMYAVMHLDEGRPHIHMGIAAVEESGKLNYRALFGRESLNDPGENLLAMQKSLAERISHLGVEATQGNDYEHTGMNAWRLLKAKEEGRQEKAAELQRETEKLNAEKSKNLALSESLETARQAALTAGRAEAAQKKRADTAESERDQAQKALGQQQASADLKTLKPPKRYTRGIVPSSTRQKPRNSMISHSTTQKKRRPERAARPKTKKITRTRKLNYRTRQKRRWKKKRPALHWLTHCAHAPRPPSKHPPRRASRTPAHPSRPGLPRHKIKSASSIAICPRSGRTTLG